MTADETLLAHTEQWGAELDQPTPDALARAERLIAAHGITKLLFGTGCRCGWTDKTCPDEATRTKHAAHVVQKLAAAGLLGALAEGVAS